MNRSPARKAQTPKGNLGGFILSNVYVPPRCACFAHQLARRVNPSVDSSLRFRHYRAVDATAILGVALIQTAGAMDALSVSPSAARTSWRAFAS